jgi:hypothetical protein
MKFFLLRKLQSISKSKKEKKKTKKKLLPSDEILSGKQEEQ